MEWGDHADRVALKSWSDRASGNFKVAKAGPPPPRGLSATAGGASVTLRWTDPGDAAITKYQYRYYSYSSRSWSAWTDIPSSGATTTTYTVTGLTNGQQYGFQVRAWRGNALPGSGRLTIMLDTPTSGG